MEVVNAEDLKALRLTALDSGIPSATDPGWP